jgi:hypothetical protein
LKRYQIAVKWEMVGAVIVEAENADEAIAIACIDPPELPKGRKVLGSYEVMTTLDELLELERLHEEEDE